MVYNNQKVFTTSKVGLETRVNVRKYKDLNKKLFKEGEDYFKVKGYEIGGASGLYYLLWTKEGLEKMADIVPFSFKKG